MKALPLLLALVLVPTALADTLNEDFEDYVIGGFFPDTVPSQDWYDYSEGAAIGMVSDDPPSITGSQWFTARANTTTDESNRKVSFTLEVPAQLTSFNFTIEGVPYDNSTGGSQQFISVDSSAPVRSMVKFYLFCNDPVDGDGCELRVKFAAIDTTGQVLVNASAGQTQFAISIVPDWLNAEYQLFVDGIDDGTFPFLEIPKDVGRIQLGQQRADVPMNVTLDDFTVVGTVNGTASAVEGDIATGIKNFGTAIRFTTDGSQFFLGLLIFIVLCMAVIVPLLALGLDNTVIPAISFFVVLAALWLVYMELWPDWISIALIVLTAALIGAILRRLVLGIQDASQGPGVVAGSLGYFIIATSLLAMSGFAAGSIELPTNAPTGEGEADQNFAVATVECVLSFFSDCSQDTETKVFAAISDALGWARAAADFLFQLLTFQLPIPVIFSAMIVLPPAAALFTLAVQTIRGSA